MKTVYLTKTEESDEEYDCDPDNDPSDPAHQDNPDKCNHTANTKRPIRITITSPIITNVCNFLSFYKRLLLELIDHIMMQAVVLHCN